MAGRLDRIDLKILRLLQNNGRLTNAELAETVGVSAATCHRRTQRLFEEGYIAQVRAMVAPRKVGKGRAGHGRRRARPLHAGELCHLRAGGRTS